MPSVINEFKRVQYISLVITKALERCFPNSDVVNIKCEYKDGAFMLGLQAYVLDYNEIYCESSDENYKKCISSFIFGILSSTDKIIQTLSVDENEVREDIKKYGVAYTESPAIPLSFSLMFREIVNGIKQ